MCDLMYWCVIMCECVITCKYVIKYFGSLITCVDLLKTELKHCLCLFFPFFYNLKRIHKQVNFSWTFCMTNHGRFQSLLLSTYFSFFLSQFLSVVFNKNLGLSVGARWRSEASGSLHSIRSDSIQLGQINVFILFIYLYERN